MRRSVAGDTILACLPNICSSVDGAWACVMQRRPRRRIVRTDDYKEGGWGMGTAGGIARRDRAPGRCLGSRRLVSRRTLSVRLATAAPAVCGGGPGFLLRDNPGTGV